jgi:hypothetical protein
METNSVGEFIGVVVFASSGFAIGLWGARQLLTIL